MDIREKLVELFYENNVRCDQKIEGLVDDVIDIISHSVTAQEWISVDEQLPQNFVSVLGYMNDAGEFPPVRECYTVGNAFFFPALDDVHPVSHWR